MAAELNSLLRAARRRLVRQEWERQLAAALRVLLSLAVVLVGADRLWRLKFDPWWLIALLLALAVAITALGSWRRRLGLQATAWVLDERLGLGERLSSAVAMEQARYDGPLRQPVVEAAEREAAIVDLRAALPGRAARALRQSAGLALALLIVALLPRQTFWRSQTDVATERVARQVGKELAAVAKKIGSQSAQAPRAEAQARALLREAIRLRRARLTKAEGLRRLERLNVKLQAERENLAGRALRRTGREARRDLRELSGLAGEVARELEDPRQDAAAQLLRELARRARDKSLSAAERRGLAEEMERAAEVLEDSPYEGQRQALAEAAEALRRGGSQEGAAKALERAADALERGSSAEQELLEELQERVESGKESLGEAEGICEGCQGGSLPDDLTEPRGGGSCQGSGPGGPAGRAGRGRGPGSTNRAAEPAPGEGVPQQPYRPGDSPDDDSKAEWERLYAPRRSETLQHDERLGGRLNRGGRLRTEQGSRQAPRLGDARVPYYEVLEDYRAEADQAVSRGDIPVTERHRVKRYFEELRAPAEEAR